jgi:DNA invertase Pin-like site-specific DNA recombinase
MCRNQRSDEILAIHRQVWKLDRFGRSLVHCVSGIQEMSSPPANVSCTSWQRWRQFERELIRERVSAGIRNAKAKGTKSGKATAHIHPC